MLRDLALGLALTAGLALPAAAQEHGGGHVKDVSFSFEGPFGSFDRNELLRGLQIYTEVCSACHGLKYVPFRALSEPGGPELPEDQMKAYAAKFQVYDPELDDTRPGKPTDHFPKSQLPNAPDLSLMAKARAGFHGPFGLGLTQLVRGIGGPEYIVNLLEGYDGETTEIAGATFYGNHIFSTGNIAMPPPLAGGDVEFADGSPNDLASEAKDVATFLMWTAEPKLMARKEAGFTAVIFLIVLSVALYLTNKRLWKPVKDAARAKGGRSTPAE